MQELVKNASKNIAASYLEDGEDPTEQMVKVARKHDLTAQQIQPVARRANRKILVKLQKGAAEEGRDPRVTFPKIKPKKVVMILRENGDLSEEMPTPPEPEKDTSVIDQIFGTSDDSSCRTEGYTLDDYKDDPDAIPNKEMALRVLNKAKNDAEQARRSMVQTENKLEDALHKLQKHAANYLRAGEPIEPLLELEGVEEDIEEVREKVACDVNSIDEPYEIRDDHLLVKLADRVCELREEYEEKQFDARVAEQSMRTFRQKIQDQTYDS